MFPFVFIAAAIGGIIWYARSKAASAVDPATKDPNYWWPTGGVPFDDSNSKILWTSWYATKCPSVGGDCVAGVNIDKAVQASSTHHVGVRFHARRDEAGGTRYQTVLLPGLLKSATTRQGDGLRVSMIELLNGIDDAPKGTVFAVPDSSFQSYEIFGGPQPWQTTAKTDPNKDLKDVVGS